MICPVIGVETPEALLAEHRRLVTEGARLVEWRLDYLTAPFDLPALLRQRPGPVIVTVRLPRDGGKWQGVRKHSNHCRRQRFGNCCCEPASHHHKSWNVGAVYGASQDHSWKSRPQSDRTVVQRESFDRISRRHGQSDRIGCDTRCRDLCDGA